MSGRLVELDPIFLCIIITRGYTLYYRKEGHDNCVILRNQCVILRNQMRK